MAKKELEAALKVNPKFEHSDEIKKLLSESR
jgi:hypothetical protein